MKEGYSSIVRIWLLTGAILVIAMVVIGGITRLTHSGLSMVNWKPITGVVPPLNELDWEIEFNNYKQFPEYQKLNYDFELSDFKSIFWWEFMHRFLGRIIGIIFVVPYLFFLFKGVFNKSWNYKLIILFVLGGLQGVIGWFMVKSGLVDNPAVSHYRLATHFLAALTVYGYILWLFFDLRKSKNTVRLTLIKTWTVILLITTIFQLIFGTFVAGLKAGLIHNTWPLMDGSFVSPLVESSISRYGFISLLENPSTIQFIHRILPFAILIPIIVLLKKVPRLDTHYKTVISIGILWLVQLLLGIFTLILKVPVILGVLHQLGGVALVSAMLYLLHSVYKSPKKLA